MKKLLNLLISILYIIEIVCSFIPYCFRLKFWADLEGNGMHTLLTNHTNNFNVYGLFFEDNLKVLFVAKLLPELFLISVVIVAILYLLKTMNKNTQITKNALKFSILHTTIMIVFLIISSTVEDDCINFYRTFQINWMFYIIILINIIALILGIVVEFGKIPNISKSEETNTIPQDENASILLDYKTLLDQGIITQEDFDKKKKEILNI